MDEQVQKAIEILKQGGIGIFPTDTAFGIGCRIDDEKAVQRLFKIRKRPETQATPVLVDTVKMCQDYLEPILKEVIDKLIETYWPGALTIILRCNRVKVPSLVRGGTNTLGVRIPNHATARAIIRGVGVPILGPSANFHGEKTPYSFEELDQELVKLVDFVVSGECSIKQASTVIDCSKKPWKVIRSGVVILNLVQPRFNRGQDLGSNGMPKQAFEAVSPQAESVRHDREKIMVIIDTSSNEEIMVGLRINGKEKIIKEKIGKQKAQVILPMIEKLLKKNKVSFQDISEIQVNAGPGSFTGLRVGVSIANALGFALGIPINNKKIGEFIEPRY